MKHDIKPFLAAKLDRVILHVRTNDLDNQSAKEIADGIVDIWEIVTKERPETNIVLSELVLRLDKPEHEQKIDKVGHNSLNIVSKTS